MAAGPVSVLMVAIGGYGFHYLKTLLEELPPARCRLAGVVDPRAEQSMLWPVVSHLGVPVHASVEAFYGEGHRADLAVISSPIHWHVPQSLVALAHGSTVLCDKPLGATIQEAQELIQARDRSGLLGDDRLPVVVLFRDPCAQARHPRRPLRRPETALDPLLLASRHELLRPQRLGRHVCGTELPAAGCSTARRTMRWRTSSTIFSSSWDLRCT